MNSIDQFSVLPFSHHAFGIESNESIEKNINEIIPNEECSYIFNRRYDSFKIDDARAIKSLQSEKTEKAAVFIIAFTLINREAQNALLKVLEEPTSNTYFILIFPSTHALLPTLQSRLSIISLNTATKDERIISASDFVDMNLQQRFDWIKQHTDRKSDLIISKSDTMKLLDDIEVYYRENDTPRETIGSIFKARKYCSANGASIKMILEMVALSL